MNTATCCLPTVLPTQRPWPLRAWESLAAGLGALRERRRRRHQSRACRALARALPRHTRHDIGLDSCLPPEPTLPALDWEFGRWR